MFNRYRQSPFPLGLLMLGINGFNIEDSYDFSNADFWSNETPDLSRMLEATPIVESPDQALTWTQGRSSMQNDPGLSMPMMGDTLDMLHNPVGHDHSHYQTEYWQDFHTLGTGVIHHPDHQPGENHNFIASPVNGHPEFMHDPTTTEFGVPGANDHAYHSGYTDYGSMFETMTQPLAHQDWDWQDLDTTPHGIGHQADSGVIGFNSHLEHSSYNDGERSMEALIQSSAHPELYQSPHGHNVQLNPTVESLVNLYGTHSIEVAEEQQRSRTAQLGAPIDHLAYYPNEHLQTFDDGVAHYPDLISPDPPLLWSSNTFSQKESPEVLRFLSESNFGNSRGMRGPSTSGGDHDSGDLSKASLRLVTEAGRLNEGMKHDLSYRHRTEGGQETPQTKLVFDADAFRSLDDRTRAENVILEAIMNQVCKEGRLVIENPTEGMEAFWLASSARGKPSSKKEEIESSGDFFLKKDDRFKIAVETLYNSRAKWLSRWEKRFPGAKSVHLAALTNRSSTSSIWEKSLLCHMFYIDMIHTIVRKPDAEQSAESDEDPVDQAIWKKAYVYLIDGKLFVKGPRSSVHRTLWYLNRLFLVNAESAYRKEIVFRGELISEETKFFFDFIFKHSVIKLTERLPS